MLRLKEGVGSRQVEIPSFEQRFAGFVLDVEALFLGRVVAQVSFCEVVDLRLVRLRLVSRIGISMCRGGVKVIEFLVNPPQIGYSVVGRVMVDVVYKQKDIRSGIGHKRHRNQYVPGNSILLPIHDSPVSDIAICGQ